MNTSLLKSVKCFGNYAFKVVRSRLNQNASIFFQFKEFRERHVEKSNNNFLCLFFWFSVYNSCDRNHFLSWPEIFDDNTVFRGCHPIQRIPPVPSDAVGPFDYFYLIAARRHDTHTVYVYFELDGNYFNLARFRVKKLESQHSFFVGGPFLTH